MATLYGAPYQVYVVGGSAVYIADGGGLIANVAASDAGDLIRLGCIDISILTTILVATAGAADRAAAYLIGDGVPISGGNGTYAGLAPSGALLVSNEPATYQNLGTIDAPLWVLIGGSGGLSLIGSIIAADMNSVADQPFYMLPSPSGSFRVRLITVTNPSIALSTATGGIYTAIDKNPTAVVANDQVYTALTAANIALDLTIVVTPGNTYWPDGTQLYLSLSTPQGAPATADFAIYGQN